MSKVPQHIKELRYNQLLWKPELEDKFLNFIDLGDNECWEWVGHKTKGGYGNFCCLGQNFVAPRAAMAIFLGESKPTYILCLHHCDNPSCVNPLHLYWGNQEDNMEDRVNRGRDSYANMTHCRKGHPFSGENLAWDRRTGTNRWRRRCKQCKRESCVKFRAKSKKPLNPISTNME